MGAIVATQEEDRGLAQRIRQQPRIALGDAQLVPEPPQRFLQSILKIDRAEPRKGQWSHESFHATLVLIERRGCARRLGHATTR